MARTGYYRCSKCKRKGLYLTNREQVKHNKGLGLGAYKVYMCKYCGHKERIWSK